jgi:putative spermidine/putrescine transport system permease protein
MYTFILAPMMYVVFASVNSSTSFPSPFEEFTTRWFTAILDHPEFIASTWTSFIVAIVSAAGATTVAALAAYALSRGKGRENAVISTILLSPLFVPQIVLSLGLMQFAAAFGIGSTLMGLFAVHTIHGLPFAFRLAVTGFAQFDFSLEDAAQSLGASRLRTWSHVTLPLLRSSLIAGFTFCFILSFVNLPISLFLTDPHTTTLPVVMYAYIESRIDPMLAAISTILVVLACVITLVLEYVLRVRMA